MKIKINDYLKTFLIDSIIYGLIILAIEYFVSNEINVWKLILLSLSVGALSSYSFVNAISRARKNQETALSDLRVKKVNR